jgi:FMN phosphatase YigB (HAD superfamily)
LNPERTIVFLLDVDNTLLDNDRFGADLGGRLETLFGAAQRDRYWALYTQLREELSYADYLGALQRFRVGLEDDPHLLQMSSFLLDYPFAERLYPRAPEVVAHLEAIGLPVIFSDGDIVFQPRKIQRSCLWNAVSGRVLVEVHKERALDAMRRAYPARHYVMVDDKPQVLARIKAAMGSGLTALLVRQGHYAGEAAKTPPDPPPDAEIAQIGDLLDFDRREFFADRATPHAN